MSNIANTFFYLLLFVGSCVLMFVGVAAPAVGIWILVNPDLPYVFSVTGLNQAPLKAAAGLMILSAVLFIMSGIAKVLKMCGFNNKMFSLKQLQQILSIMSISLCIGVTFGMIVASGVFLDSINPGIEDTMREDIQTRYINEWSTDLVSTAWNQIQVDWKCCGSTNYADYNNSEYSAFFGNSVPWTCCVMSGGGNHSLHNVLNETICRIEAESPDVVESLYLHTKGCYRMVDEVLYEVSVTALVISCLVFVPQVVELFIAIEMLRVEKD